MRSRIIKKNTFFPVDKIYNHAVFIKSSDAFATGQEVIVYSPQRIKHNVNEYMYEKVLATGTVVSADEYGTKISLNRTCAAANNPVLQKISKRHTITKFRPVKRAWGLTRVEAAMKPKNVFVKPV